MEINKFTNLFIKINIILYCCILIDNRIVQSNHNIDYFTLQNNYNKAYNNYKNRQFNSAEILFNNIIKNDINNVFWESYYYLSQIYLSESKRDSALFILNEGLKRESPDPNALGFYEVAIYSINNNISIDIEDQSSYIDIYNKIIKISLHPFPNVNPMPIIGLEKFKDDVKSIVCSYFKKEIQTKFFLVLTIDNEGNVGRIQIFNQEFDIHIIEKIYEYIFASKWIPAKENNKNINCWISLPIDLK